MSEKQKKAATAHNDPTKARKAPVKSVSNAPTRTPTTRRVSSDKSRRPSLQTINKKAVDQRRDDAKKHNSVLEVMHNAVTKAFSPQAPSAVRAPEGK